MKSEKSRKPAFIIAIYAIVTTVAMLLLFVIAGQDEAAIQVVLRITARIAVILFALAFATSGLHKLLGNRATAWLLRNRRYIGLTFAATHFIHLGAIATRAWLFPVPFLDNLGAVTFIGGGSTYLLLAMMALTSNDMAVRKLGRKKWRALHLIGSYAIWVSFTRAYVTRAVKDPAFAPIAVVLLAVFVVRVLAYGQRSRKRRAEQRRGAMATTG